MIDFFYSLPVGLAAILVMGTSLAVGLGTSFGLRRLLGLGSSDAEMDNAVSLMQVVAAYIGILIAFAGVQVWQDFADAENAVHREAASAAALYRDLASYGPETLEARQNLRAYANSIVTEEWPLLPEGQASAQTDIKLFRLYDAVGKIRPNDYRDSTIYSEAFSNLDDLVGLRRDRLIHSGSGMPVILWIVGLAGSMLIVGYTATFPHTLANVVMIAGISLALGLVFLFILIVDRPYMGNYSVSNAELVALGERFDVLDRLSGAQQSPGQRE